MPSGRAVPGRVESVPGGAAGGQQHDRRADPGQRVDVPAVEADSPVDAQPRAMPAPFDPPQGISTTDSGAG